MITVLVNWGLARYERTRAWIARHRQAASDAAAAPTVKPARGAFHASVAGESSPQVASLVILNWERPANVRRILNTYVAFDAIDDVVVWNNNGAEFFEYSHPKVRCINSTEFGLNTRWLGCLLARHACVIVHDDDLLCDEATVGRLIAAHYADPQRTYSLHGRNPTATNRYGTKIDHVAEPTECDVHLTRATCINRRLVSRYFDALADLGIDIDPANGGGEDIVISYAIRAATGRRPVVVPGSYEDLVAPHAIANRYGSQSEARTRIMHACQRWFEQERVDQPC